MALKSLNQKIYLTETELAERWITSKRTLQAWRQQGKPPVFTKLGRAIRYPIGGIEHYENNALTSSTQNSTGQATQNKNDAHKKAD